MQVHQFSPVSHQTGTNLYTDIHGPWWKQWVDISWLLLKCLSSLWID